MSKKKENKSKDKKNENNPITKLPALPQNNSEEKEGQIRETPDNIQQKKTIYNRIITLFSNETNQPKVANIISLAMVVVTFLLFVYTYRLYKTAAEDSKTARQSAKAADNSAVTAQNTLDETKKYDSLSLIKQQKAIDDNNEGSKQAFDRANRSLTLQDSSLRETQKEFEIENKPFVQITDIKFDTLEKDKPIAIRYVFCKFGETARKMSN